MKGISVIIPVFNRETFLAEAIQSVLDQGCKGSLEIIVSDDGSTDRSADIAISFGPPVKIVLRPPDCAQPRGAAAARNRGLAAATQPYVAFLDSDDFLLPGHLNRLARIMDKDASLGFAFSRMLQMKTDERGFYYAPWTRAALTDRDISNPLVSRSYIVSTNILLFRRSVFERVGTFNECYSNGEDGDMWLRISEQYPSAFADHFGAVYRLAHGSEQLTDRARLHRCASRIWAAALGRYADLRLNNRFHLFRLRLITAVLGSGNCPMWRHIASLTTVALHHPVHGSSHIVGRLMERIHPPPPLVWSHAPSTGAIRHAFSFQNSDHQGVLP